MTKEDLKSLVVTIRFYSGYKDKDGLQKSLPAGEAWAEGDIYVPVNRSRGVMSSKRGVQFNGLDQISKQVGEALKAHNITFARTVRRRRLGLEDPR